MIIHKIKRVASILLIFLIVLSTNLVDKENFNKLKKSVTTIYEDRIVASDLLFEIAMLIHEKEVALVAADSLFFDTRNQEVNLKIKEYILNYELTKLTDKEHTIFNNFKDEYQHLQKLEEQQASSQVSKKDELLKSVKVITLKLQHLSKIQLNEGKQQVFMSNATMKSINLFTQVEIIFLIVMAILIQIIIFSDPKKKKKQ